MKLDKYQENVTRAKANQNRIVQALAIAEAALLADPDNRGKATDVITYTAQAKAAEAGVQKALNELEAAERKANSPETKAALKDLEKINKEGKALTDEITKDAEALRDKMAHWFELQQKSKQMAREYNGKPFDLGIAGSRLITLKTAVDRWTEEVHNWGHSLKVMAERRNAKPANPRRVIPLSERDKMINERYPEPRG